MIDIPRSDCCGASTVYYRADAGRYVVWLGWGLPDVTELRCNKCNRPCEERITDDTRRTGD